MPHRAKRPCSTPKCPNLVEGAASRCPEHEREHDKQSDTKTIEERRFYASNRWRVTSERHRAKEPFCRECAKDGRVTLGKITDHITPLRQNGARWSESNLQTLCREHDQQKRNRERRGIKN
jgi:5-methylcytosine-specific restriction enzyme A